MRELLTGRIVGARWKLLYALGVWFFGAPLFWMIPRHPVPDAVISMVGLVSTLVGVWYGARVFRAPAEPLAPARAWWRLTAWPGLSWLLGLLFLVTSIVWVFHPQVRPLGPWDVAWGSALVTQGVLAIAYLNSAVRLSAAGIRKPLPQRRVLLQPPDLG